MAVEYRALTEEPVAVRFRAMESILSSSEAAIEAERCYFCFDAPCTRACPAEIDIPAFIRALAVGQPARATSIILRENPLGMSCARVCPVETLCEAVCVRGPEAGGAVRIGQLQREAMEAAKAVVAAQVVDSTVRRVAMLGAGPAGMTLAYLLAEEGVRVDLFDAAPRPGGLNETGIAAYKMLDDAAQTEAQRVLASPHIRFVGESPLGTVLSLSILRQQYDAVALAVGLAAQRRLEVPGESLPGVQAAVPFIAAMRRGERLPVGQSVVVIGGGMTAIDIAIQIRLLGAESVHICYRRGVEDMGASAHERQLARDQGVHIHPGLRPVEIRQGAEGRLELRLQRVHRQAGQWEAMGAPECWTVDQIFTAIGQTLDREPWSQDPLLMDLALDTQGKIAVDDTGRTNLPGVWAAGDCAGRSPDLTVHAVADAKRVARAMLAFWKAQEAS